MRRSSARPPGKWRRGAAAVETGSSSQGIGSALFMAIWVVVAIVVAAVFPAATPKASLWWAPAIVVVPMLLLVFNVWRYLGVHRPRPIAALRDLERYLPRHG